MARRLIIVWAVLTVLADVAVALPGNPYYSSTGGTLAGLLIQAVLFWAIWHRRSDLAWTLAVLGSALVITSSALVGMDLESGWVMLIAISIAQLLVLCTPPVLAYVWRSDPPRPVASH
jgi:hypothetical protein